MVSFLLATTHSSCKSFLAPECCSILGQFSDDSTSLTLGPYPLQVYQLYTSREMIIVVKTHGESRFPVESTLESNCKSSGHPKI
jgi:hypothetical protein